MTPAQAAPAPLAPTAPPLPFQYFGRTEVVGEPGQVLIHLQRGEQVFSVRVGEQIDEQYRLERMDEAALVIDYLPLATKQTLSIGTR